MTLREQFEAAISAVLVKEGYSPSSVPQLLERGSDGEYRSIRVKGAWWGWEASPTLREALVIQLPNQFDPIYQEFFDDVDGGCFNYSKYLNDVREVLAAAGLKVKP